MSRAEMVQQASPERGPELLCDECGAPLVALWLEATFTGFDVVGCLRGHAYTYQVGGNVSADECRGCWERLADPQFGPSVGLFRGGGYCSVECRDSDTRERLIRMLYVALNVPPEERPTDWMAELIAALRDRGVRSNAEPIHVEEGS